MFVRTPLFRSPKLYRTKALAARRVLPSSEGVASPEIPAAGPSTYLIQRTASDELPVYTDVRNDGGAKTVVRKISVSADSVQLWSG